MNQLERAGDDGLSAGDVKRVGAALEASIAPNTAKAYRAALARFAAWLDGRPATDATVAAYVAALMDQGKAPATIRQAAAAIGAGARAQGLDDPRGPLARQALAGAVRRNAGEGRGQVAGVRREDALAAAAAAAAEGTASGLRDAALLHTMSDALLRASELAAIGTSDVERESDGQRPPGHPPIEDRPGGRGRGRLPHAGDDDGAGAMACRRGRGVDLTGPLRRADTPASHQVRGRVRTRAADHQRRPGDRAQARRRGRGYGSQRTQLPGSAARSPSSSAERPLRPWRSPGDGRTPAWWCATPRPKRPAGGR